MNNLLLSSYWKEKTEEKGAVQVLLYWKQKTKMKKQQQKPIKKWKNKEKQSLKREKTEWMKSWIL